MLNENIGALIKKLRTENNYTQKELAYKLNVCRQAVSNWETGKSIPDYDQLLSLSKLFGITIDELLYDNKITKSKITKYLLSLLNETNKYKRIIHKLILICFVLIIFLIGYYFITNYNKINVYEIYGDENKIKCNFGLLVKTTDTSYFKTCEFVIIDPNVILSESANIEYYYMVGDTRKLILESGSNVNLLKDNSSASELFDYENIDEVLANLYVDIKDGENVYTIKLNYKKTFSNSKFKNPFINNKM